MARSGPLRGSPLTVATLRQSVSALGLFGLLACSGQKQPAQQAPGKAGLTQGWDVPELPDDLKEEAKAEEAAPKGGLTQGWDVPELPDDLKDKDKK